MKVFEYLRFPQTTFSYVVLSFSIIILFLLFLYFFYLFKSFYDKKRYREFFFKEALEKGLTEEEAEILWNYSVKEGRDPFLTLEFKVVFEKVVDLYLKSSSNPSEEIVRRMREKLCFDEIPYFVPIVSTKDIELFQPAKVEFSDGYRADIVLFDKDEYYMYWAFADPVPLNRIGKGDTVSITFVRKGDAVYKLSLPVDDVYEEIGRVFIKIPHTFNFERYQRRNYPRVEVDIACKVSFTTGEGTVVIDGRLKDISLGGARACLPLEEVKSYLSLFSEIKLEFFLEGNHLSLKGRVASEDIREKAVCLGIEFIEPKEKAKQIIDNFVKKEQKKLAELYVRRGT